MISFSNAYTKAVDWQDKDAILTLFEQQGFVVFGPAAFPVGVSDSEAQLRWLESRFNLGEHKPSVYNETLYPERLKASGYNQIGEPNEPVALSHAAFDDNQAQGFHVDGIFRPSGELKTILLACQQSAQSGGENPLCNLIGIITQIREQRPDLIAPLQDPRSIRRRSCYEGNDRCATQPILSFDTDTQREVVNLSMDDTVDWAYSFARVPKLEEAINEIKQQMREGSPYRLTVRLTKGDVLMLDNIGLAHARTAFVDTSEARRVIVRGKYKALPS